jgi:hypothetical protein
MCIYDKRQRVIEKTNKQKKIIIMGVEEKRNTNRDHQSGMERRRKEDFLFWFCILSIV